MSSPKSFASDNFSGAHPTVLSAIAQANFGHTHSYGADPFTDRAVACLQQHLGLQARVYFVFNGTAANVLSLRAMVPSYGAIVCPVTAHINVDECGAPENALGCKLLTVKTADGKLRPEDLAPLMHHKGDQHHAQPWAISVSQPTELGTLYSLPELRELFACAHAHGLKVHMDGARLSNAAAALNCSLADLVEGVDALSLGGTKNGLLFGEAVVFLNPEIGDGFPFIRKQNMQLFSKMRFVGAQFLALYEGDLWLQNAKNANTMAALLAEKVAGKVSLCWPRQTNALFVTLSKERIAALQADHFFYIWDEERGIVRWMTSWDTAPEEVEAFARLVST